MLHLFLSNRGTVMTHEALARSLWGDQVNSSALAKKYVQRLRRKLGDCPENPEWLVNVHGVGYKFLGSRVPEREGIGVLS